MVTLKSNFSVRMVCVIGLVGKLAALMEDRTEQFKVP
jgi:hypothetical protein